MKEIEEEENIYKKYLAIENPLACITHISQPKRMVGETIGGPIQFEVAITQKVLTSILFTTETLAVPITAQGIGIL